jgi:hypothetical protein
MEYIYKTLLLKIESASDQASSNYKLTGKRGYEEHEE